MSLLPAPTTCRYTVVGPCWPQRCSRLSLVLTRRSGSLWRPFRGPGGCLCTGSRLVEDMARRSSWGTPRARPWRWWLVEGELPPRRNACVRSRRFTWTVLIIGTSPRVIQMSHSASLQGESTRLAQSGHSAALREGPSDRRCSVLKQQDFKGCCTHVTSTSGI